MDKKLLHYSSRLAPERIRVDSGMMRVIFISGAIWVNNIIKSDLVFYNQNDLPMSSSLLIRRCQCAVVFR